MLIVYTLVIVAQSLQQFLTVSILIFSKSLNIEQIAHEGLCFVAMMVVIMAVGMLGGFIRSLRKIGFIANAAVWMNIVNFIIWSVHRSEIRFFCLLTMFVIAWSHPQTSSRTTLPSRKLLSSRLSSLSKSSQGFRQTNINNNRLALRLLSTQSIPWFVCDDRRQRSIRYLRSHFLDAYAGALLFVAFLSEMRHPLDFWKGMFMAQAFICIVYMFFGVFVSHLFPLLRSLGCFTPGGNSSSPLHSATLSTASTLPTIS